VVLLRGIVESKSLPVGGGIERGDTLQVTGSESSVQKLAPLIAQSHARQKRAICRFWDSQAGAAGGRR
jgi:hypothetical protein